MDVVILILSFVLILGGAELFTNGIEWFGRKLQLAEGAVGSVLAAVGTALPETMIPIIAIIFSTGEHSNAIGIGAILGAPFMLATLAMFVSGTAVMIMARKRADGDVMRVDPAVLAQDMRSFGIAYALAIGTAFLPADLTWARWAVAIVLLVLYALYVRAHFEADPGTDLEDISPLRFHRLDRQAHRADPHLPRLRVVNLQVLAALSLIVIGATYFVGAVEHLGSQLGVPAVLLALVVAPIATELPEKFNSVIWIRQGKDTLSMGNITGAMVFQSAIPVAVALVFAPESWVATGDSMIAFVSAGIALLSSAVIFLPMARSGRLRGRSLMVGGLFYLGYLAFVIVAAGGSR